MALTALTACGNNGTTKAADKASEPEPSRKTVKFDADSAYAFVAQQVEFGPRVPNTKAHRECSDWLAAKLNQYNAPRVSQQHTQVRAYDGTPLDICNITASFNPEANKRILLLSHWDSRPWADQETDPALRDKPIDGANDGASGVGVILEICRQLSMSEPSIGVDILFTDAEDYGARSDSNQSGDESSWCLGTQYWVENPPIELDKIRYAILLDMVGGKDAVFHREYFSQMKAKDINDKVWGEAKKAGFSGRFIDRQGSPVIDDHIHLLKMGIPAIDIIESSHPQTGSFNPTWHTHADNIDNIDKETLGIVGQTLINLIYGE